RCCAEEVSPPVHGSRVRATATSSRPSATTSSPDFVPARCERAGASGCRPSLRSTRRHDRRAGAFELGKFAAPRHLHLQLAAIATDDRTVGIGLIKGVQQAPPPGASSAAGPDIVAVPAGGRHPARLANPIALA